MVFGIGILHPQLIHGTATAVNARRDQHLLVMRQSAAVLG
jgi:hypothetical protein